MATFLGEIRRFPYAAVPDGWVVCEGQVLEISEYTELYSLLNGYYGGNGSTTFALPDLRGRTPTGTSDSNVIGTTGGGSGTSASYLTLVYAIATTGSYPSRD